MSGGYSGSRLFYIKGLIFDYQWAINEYKVSNCIFTFNVSQQQIRESEHLGEKHE